MRKTLSRYSLDTLDRRFCAGDHNNWKWEQMEGSNMGMDVGLIWVINLVRWLLNQHWSDDSVQEVVMTGRGLGMVMRVCGRIEVWNRCKVRMNY